MENGFSTPKDIREQYESELRVTKGGWVILSKDSRTKNGGDCSTRTRTRELAAGGAALRRPRGITVEAVTLAGRAPA